METEEQSPDVTPNRLPAGWYRNLKGPGQRYWDGAAWTDRTQPGPNGARADMGIGASGFAGIALTVLAVVLYIALGSGLPIAAGLGLTGLVILAASWRRGRDI